MSASNVKLELVFVRIHIDIGIELEYIDEYNLGIHAI